MQISEYSKKPLIYQIRKIKKYKLAAYIMYSTLELSIFIQILKKMNISASLIHQTDRFNFGKKLNIPSDGYESYLQTADFEYRRYYEQNFISIPPSPHIFNCVMTF